MTADIVRETCEKAPAPSGDWDGTTRAGALAALLAKAEEELAKPQVEAPKWAARMKSMLGLGAAAAVALAAASSTSSSTRPTPAEAAAILARSGSPANWTGRAAPADGPTVAVFGQPGALGPWAFPPDSPRRRLDGSLLTDPPAFPAAYWPPFFHGRGRARGGRR